MGWGRGGDWHILVLHSHLRLSILTYHIETSMENSPEEGKATEPAMGVARGVGGMKEGGRGKEERRRGTACRRSSRRDCSVVVPDVVVLVPVLVLVLVPWPELEDAIATSLRISYRPGQVVSHKTQRAGGAKAKAKQRNVVVRLIDSRWPKSKSVDLLPTAKVIA